MPLKLLTTHPDYGKVIRASTSNNIYVDHTHNLLYFGDNTYVRLEELISIKYVANVENSDNDFYDLGGKIIS